MRILLDLQGAQGRARGSGLGRYALEFARAIARAPGRHEVAVLVNDGAAAAGELVAEFGALLGPRALHRWTPPEGATGAEPRAPWHLAAERLRAAKVAEVAPDLLVLGSVHEGFDDPCTATWPADLARPLTAAVVHDLIPLTHRALYLDAGWRAGGRVPWFFRGLQELAECDLLLANSEATRAEALAHLGPRPVVTIGGGISHTFAPPPPDPEARRRLRDRYGLAPGAVLFLGAGDYRKNHAALIEAYALLPEPLRARHPLAIGHARPWEMGDGGLPPAQFLRLPFIAEADLPAAYASAAVLCFPSLAEGFGLPLAEAMACGCPVLAGRVSAMPEVVGRDDALFDPRDPHDIARLLRRALEDDAWRAELSVWGRRRAREFSWAGVAARTLDAVEGLTLRAACLAPRPRLAVVAPGHAAAEAVAARLGGRYAITLATEAPSGDPEAARFRRIAWAGLDAEPPFDRILHLPGSPLVSEWPGVSLGEESGALERLDLPEGALPALWCEAVERTHRDGPRAARLAAARLVAALPTGAEGLPRLRAALDLTWPPG